MQDLFWQANFWGIVGTVTGALGLIISYKSWKYSRPNIKITHLVLKMRRFDDDFIRLNKDTPSNKLQRNVLEINLEIKLANKRGGPGAIEKPLLIFKIPKKFFWERCEEIEIEPNTKSYSTTRLSENYSETETINLGKSFNLNGGEIIDDELEYRISGSRGVLQNLIGKYEKGDFFIRFANNFGRRYEKKLKITLTS